MTSLFTRALFASVLCAAASPRSTAAQPAPPTAGQRADTELLVPPQGGAFEAPIHAGTVCILSFGEPLSTKALASSADFEIKSWGTDEVAVRAIGATAKTTTLALATSTGSVKVNMTLTVVPADQPAYTLVRFKAVTAEEAFEAQLKVALAQRVAPLEAELARLRQDLDARIRDRADGLIAERMLRRNEAITLSARERNDDHVIVHVTRAFLLGDDGYLVFEIQNRSAQAFRLASVSVVAGGLDITGPARLATQAVDRDPRWIGVVAAGATARGIVSVRSVNRVLGQPLAVTLAGPAGAGAIRLDRGIVLR
jgi:hypothetical protein